MHKNTVSNPKVDEEKKVEAVRKFYAYAAENKTAFASAERMLFFGKFSCPSSRPSLISARVGVPFCILAFSSIYWGYGLTMYMTTS